MPINCVNDTSQLYPYSLCQPMPIGFVKRWDFDPQTSKVTPPQNKIGSFENKVMSYFQRTRPDCIIENFSETCRQMQIDCFNFDGFFLIATLCSKQFAAFATFVLVQKFDRLSLKTIVNVVVRRESSIIWDETIYKKTASLSVKCESVNDADCTRQAIKSKNISEKIFDRDVHLQPGNCDIGVPENLGDKLVITSKFQGKSG